MNPLRQALTFFRTMSTWLGEGGKPVPQATAQVRANICLLCAHHKPSSTLTRTVAGVTKRQIALKNNMHLHVDGEADLGQCGLCGCEQVLKVWVPLETARANTPDWERFPQNCWLHRE